MKAFFCLIAIGITIAGACGAATVDRRRGIVDPVPRTRLLPPSLPSTIKPSYPPARPEAGKEILPGMETGRDRDLYMVPLPGDGNDLQGNTYRGKPQK